MSVILRHPSLSARKKASDCFVLLFPVKLNHGLDVDGMVHVYPVAGYDPLNRFLFVLWFDRDFK